MKALISHKKARFDFEILDTFEAGIVLLGTEVKSVKKGQGKLEGSHVIVRGKEAFLVGASIPAFQKANAPKDYEPERPRKLLLKQKELKELETKEKQAGLTIVPIKLYNKGSNIKVEIGVARGKKMHDKRQSIKERDNKRSVDRTLKTQY